MMDPNEIEVVVFDAYGTLFDVRSVEAAVSEVTADAEAFTAAWRRAQLEATWLQAAMRTYTDFWTVTQQALDRVANAHALELSAASQRRLMEGWMTVRAFPEVPVALARLGAGRRLAIFSNGTPRMLDEAIKANGLENRFEAVLSVDSVGAYKPDPKAYSWALEQLSVKADRMLFVSANDWDVAGAANAGLPVLWLDRAGLSPRRPGADERVARDLGKVANLIS